MTTHRRMGLGLSIVVVVTLSGYARAQPAATRRLAVFPVATQEDGGRVKWLKAVDNQLQRLGRKSNKETRLVVGEQLKRRLRRSPAEARRSCGEDVACLAELGRLAKAEGVVLGTASALPDGGVRVLWQYVDTESGETTAEAETSFAARKEIKTALEAEAASIFQLTEAGTLTLRGATGDVWVDGEKIGAGRGPHSVKPGQHSVVVDETVLTVTIWPGRRTRAKLADGEPASAETLAALTASASAVAETAETPPAPPDAPPAPTGEGEAATEPGADTTAEPAAALADASAPAADDSAPGADAPTADATGTPAAVSPEVVEATAVDEAASQPDEGHLTPPVEGSEPLFIRPWLGYGGIATAGVGIGCLAVGGILAAQSGSRPRTAIDLVRPRLNTGDSGSTALLITGAILTVAGAGAAGVAMFWPADTTVDLQVHEDGAGAVFTTRW